MMITEDKIQAIKSYCEAKYFSGYKEGYVIGFITDLLIGIVSVSIFDTLKLK